jgi:hypothetical protein
VFEGSIGFGSDVSVPVYTSIKGRASQIRSMPFTGDSSDSESDGGGEGTTGGVAGTGVENTVATIERAISTKIRGITPTIINQPPTPLLSRKKHPPCTLTQVPDRAAGCYDHSVAAYKSASPALSPKYAVNKLDANLTTSASLKFPLNNNNNNNMLEQTVSPPEAKQSSTFAHPNPNGFIPSSPYSAKTPTRCAVLTSTSKKLDVVSCDSDVSTDYVIPPDASTGLSATACSTSAYGELLQAASPQPGPCGSRISSATSGLITESPARGKGGLGSGTGNYGTMGSMDSNR